MPGGHGCSAPSPPPGWLQPSPPEPALPIRLQLAGCSSPADSRMVQADSSSMDRMHARQPPANLGTLKLPTHPVGRQVVQAHATESFLRGISPPLQLSIMQQACAAMHADHGSSCHRTHHPRVQQVLLLREGAHSGGILGQREGQLVGDAGCCCACYEHGAPGLAVAHQVRTLAPDPELGSCLQLPGQLLQLLLVGLLSTGLPGTSLGPWDLGTIPGEYKLAGECAA